jgi:hypothetical protein
MTKEEFADIAKHIRAMYPGRDLFTDKDVCAEWYKHFQKEDHDDLLEAARNHADKNEYPPTIASLKLNLKQLNEEKQSQTYMLESHYNTGVICFPGGGSPGARKLFLAKCREVDDFEEQFRRAMYMAVKIRDFGLNPTEEISLYDFIEREFK